MGKKLAIKGHSTRGKEVIELLEMMGGSNVHKHTGNNNETFYYIDVKNNIDCDWTLWNNNRFTIFTLEEFLEKYPFKVGDKVVYTKYGDNCDDYPVTIVSMKWTGTTIEYTFDDYVTCLAKDLKMWNGEPNTVISGIYLNSYDYADEMELNLGDYEIVVRDGRTFAVKKKPVYPKTIEECVKLLGVDFRLDMDSYKRKLMANFYRLIICHDAYWEIAGEEMGLGKHWEPDWNDSTSKYTIVVIGNDLVEHYTFLHNCILAFPIKEMRDTFCENFKDLIEQCKELL